MTLTDEKIRIKVAESMGWINFHQAENGDGNTLMGWWRGPPRTSLAIPNYPESLDACAEFESALTPLEFEEYRWILWDLCKRLQFTEWHRAYLSSTPRQRCLAYLKTKGLIP